MNRFLLLLTVLTGIAGAQVNKDATVVYTSDFSADPLLFTVQESRAIYFTKQGKNRLGTATEGRSAELLAFNERAFKIRTQGRNGKIVGWIAPSALTCADPDFIENFQKLYTRQMLVQDYIERGEVAIGMTESEVLTIMGEPTKTSLRRTAQGNSGTLEYTETYEQKHYQYITDPRTGQTFRQLTHTTTEIQRQTKIEFTNHSVTAIEQTEGKTVRPQTIRIMRPIYRDPHRFIVF